MQLHSQARTTASTSTFRERLNDKALGLQMSSPQWIETRVHFLHVLRELLVDKSKLLVLRPEVSSFFVNTDHFKVN